MLDVNMFNLNYRDLRYNGIESKGREELHYAPASLITPQRPLSNTPQRLGVILCINMRTQEAIIFAPALSTPQILGFYLDKNTMDTKGVKSLVPALKKNIHQVHNLFLKYKNTGTKGAIDLAPVLANISQLNGTEEAKALAKMFKLVIDYLKWNNIEPTNTETVLRVLLNYE